jgi:hypothetical protein
VFRNDQERFYLLKSDIIHNNPEILYIRCIFQADAYRPCTLSVPIARTGRYDITVNAYAAIYGQY